LKAYPKNVPPGTKRGRPIGASATGESCPATLYPEKWIPVSRPRIACAFGPQATQLYAE
jgi:hypothetical protein